MEPGIPFLKNQSRMIISTNTQAKIVEPGIPFLKNQRVQWKLLISSYAEMPCTHVLESQQHNRINKVATSYQCTAVNLSRLVKICFSWIWHGQSVLSSFGASSHAVEHSCLLLL